MHADHAARADSRRSSLGAKTGTVGAITNGQIGLLEDFFAMNIGHRRFGRGQKIKRAEAFGIETFLNCVSLVLEFWKLADTDHAVALDDVGRRNFGVAVLSRMQFQQKLDERAFEFRAPAGIKKKAAARQLRAALEINQLKRLTKLEVALGF